MLILATGRNYASNNEYDPSNEISLYFSVHLHEMFVCCIAGQMASQAEETFSLVSVVRRHHNYL